MADVRRVTAIAFIVYVVSVCGRPERERDSYPCNVRARTEAGWVCGLARWAEEGNVYASFRGVPYAKQPLGELRFQELQPPEPWDDLFDARSEGPVCYQTDVVYGPLMQPQGMSEACIHANIHVPIEALPDSGVGERLVRELQPPYQAAFGDVDDSGLPILVFIHGGGYMCGSGDTDLHGPEYLVTKKVIVITFNYRLNVFGFLSLASKEIPGNQGLRDMVTLLKWVQRNARSFGGDPDNVTLMGQSAGAAAAHLLTLSKAAEGLFKRAFLMSGTAISTFYSTSPFFSDFVLKLFLAQLNINSVKPEEIHQQLIQIPAKKINEAHRVLLDQFGLVTFVPTVEESFPGVTRILDDDPEVLLAKGRGKDIPLITGFTNNECEVFRNRLEELDIVARINKNPLSIVPPKLIYTTPPAELPAIVKTIGLKYYNGSLTMDGFMKYCTDAYYKYPALKLAQEKSKSGDSPMYLYEFSYEGARSVLREAFGLRYAGAAHVEDLTYVFRVNSALGTHDSFPPKQQDDFMKDWLTRFLVNFMQCSSPICIKKQVFWPAVSPRLSRQLLDKPGRFLQEDLTEGQHEILRFFDSLRP